MDDRTPWSHEELQEMIPAMKSQLDAEMSEVEAQEPGIKPLPPLATEECLDYFCRLLDVASERPLTREECFIHGQLLSQYAQAVIAEKMGKKGRFYVVSEEDIMKLMAEQKK